MFVGFEGCLLVCFVGRSESEESVFVDGGLGDLIIDDGVMKC